MTVSPQLSFPADRAQALEQLHEFVIHGARDYGKLRNFDYGAGQHKAVSRLSPAIRLRLVSEWQVCQAILDKHPYEQVEKFLQEVCWRTYWKGWLEQRPQVWQQYRRDLAALKQQSWPNLAAAVAGETGIDCFDDWIQELVTTGYLHNHARMWFASIWIYTLSLPWQLGADFFYHHLLDADSASNTLSWRWVGGLHTQGKTYLARADNIAKYTAGRYRPMGLANEAQPLPADVVAQIDREPLVSLPESARPGAAWLLWPDDWELDTLLHHQQPRMIGLVCPRWERSNQSKVVQDYLQTAFDDVQARLSAAQVPCTVLASHDQFAEWIQETGDASIYHWQPYVGEGAELLGDLQNQISVPIQALRRPWDAAFFPHAKAGFFRLKKEIPRVLAEFCS